MQEKRKLERFDLKVPARIEGLKTEEGEDILDLVTSDICSGGAFFHTEKCLPEGTKVRIDLVLPLERLRVLVADYDHAHIKVTGTVIRKTTQGMAVCFNRDYSIQPRKKRQCTRFGIEQTSGSSHTTHSLDRSNVSLSETSIPDRKETERRSGEDRRAGMDRRRYADPDYNDEERRKGNDRRLTLERRTQINVDRHFLQL